MTREMKLDFVSTQIYTRFIMATYDEKEIEKLRNDPEFKKDLDNAVAEVVRKHLGHELTEEEMNKIAGGPFAAF